MMMNLSKYIFILLRGYMNDFFYFKSVILAENLAQMTNQTEIELNLATAMRAALQSPLLQRCLERASQLHNPN